MAIGKKLSFAERVAEAYGPQVTDPSDAGVHTPEQLALRRVAAGPTKGKPQQIQDAIAVLEAEFASGSMPVSRQEAIVAICRYKPAERKHLETTDIQRLSALMLNALLHPQSEINWQQPMATTYLSLHMHPTAHHAMYGHEAAIKTEFQPRDGTSILTWVLKHSVLRQAMEARGGIPLRALGADPVRSVLAALPASNKGDDCKKFLKELDYFGVAQAESPSKSNSTPLLILILARLGESLETALSQDWIDVVKKADTLPWLRFDHKTALWRGAHPLWALASAAMHGSNKCQGWPEAAAALIRMGYGPNGERPEGKEFKMNEAANLFEKQNPNALWAFLNAPQSVLEMGDVYATLLKNGADWKAKSQGYDDQEPLSLLAKINKKAKNTSAKTAERAALENAFEQVVRVGGDPMDALPPPSRLMLAPGKIQQMVDARIEQRALRQTMSDADVEEGLALLAESRAKKAAEKAARDAQAAQSGPEASIPAPRSRGNRL